MRPANLSIRVDLSNPDHHLWNNHGTWWCHYTLHRGGRQRRVRLSLATADRSRARALRDALFKALGCAEAELALPARAEHAPREVHV